jgi:hypothetical protein
MNHMTADGKVLMDNVWHQGGKQIPLLSEDVGGGEARIVANADGTAKEAVIRSTRSDRPTATFKVEKGDLILVRKENKTEVRKVISFYKGLIETVLVRKDVWSTGPNAANILDAHVALMEKAKNPNKLGYCQPKVEVPEGSRLLGEIARVK